MLSCQRLAALQSPMHAGLVESQQKNRTLRDSLRATERQLELARKTIERLSNERTLIEVCGLHSANSAYPAIACPI